jgi:hypothetical protein
MAPLLRPTRLRPTLFRPLVGRDTGRQARSRRFSHPARSGTSSSPARVDLAVPASCGTLLHAAPQSQQAPAAPRRTAPTPLQSRCTPLRQDVRRAAGGRSRDRRAPGGRVLAWRPSLEKSRVRGRGAAEGGGSTAGGLRGGDCGGRGAAGAEASGGRRPFRRPYAERRAPVLPITGVGGRRRTGGICRDARHSLPAQVSGPFRADGQGPLAISLPPFASSSRRRKRCWNFSPSYAPSQRRER